MTALSKPFLSLMGCCGVGFGLRILVSREDRDMDDGDAKTWTIEEPGKQICGTGYPYSEIQTSNSGRPGGPLYQAVEEEAPGCKSDLNWLSTHPKTYQTTAC